MFNNKNRHIAWLGIASFLIVAPAIARAISFSGVGDLDGGDYRSDVFGISPDGSTVVGGSSSEFGYEAFRWRAATGPVGLGDLPSFGFASGGNAASSDGDVVVGAGVERPWGPDAFRWTPETGVRGLITYSNPFDPAQSNIAYGVSGDGSVVVGGPTTDGLGQAFRWEATTGWVGLGDLYADFGDRVWSVAHGISEDGSTIVGWGEGNLGREAFRWTASTGMIGLGQLSRGGGVSVANAVSSDGSVIVGWSTSPRGNEAFRWDASRGMVGLGFVQSDQRDTRALAVSGNGSVIVGRTFSPTGLAPMIWDEANGMRDLRVVLASLGLDISGWTLTEATGVSRDGLVVVGQGINPSGNPEGWIAVIPEPGTSVLVSLGLLGLSITRKTRQSA